MRSVKDNVDPETPEALALIKHHNAAEKTFGRCESELTLDALPDRNPMHLLGLEIAPKWAAAGGP